MQPQAISAYQEVGTVTASGLGLTLLLFDGAIRALGEARRSLERGDAPGFARSQARAHAIVFLLADSLNHEAGGEIAGNLARLYDFMLRHLTEGLLARSPAHLERVAGLLGELRDGFAAVSAPAPA
jgi:flagellar protein FliS